MITYEIEFHKVSSLPTNNENYRGHVFFNDATNEPIETTIDEEGNEVQKRRYERGIYLCAYDGTGRLSYIPYTVAGAGGDDVGMDIDTLNDRITLWASKFQNDIQNLAKLTVDPSQISAQAKKFYNELNGEIADLRIKSDQIKVDVAKDINGVRQQYTQFTVEADKINSKVENLKTGLSQVEQTANGITSRVESLESGWSQVEQTATEFRTTVNDNINNLSSRISQTASTISSVVENLDNVKSQIEQFPNQIKMEVSDGLNSASILETINNDESEVKIKADKIQLGGIIIHDNDIASSNGKFSVTDKGLLTAKSGSIGGIEIQEDSISSSNGSFSITDKGVLTATNANITGAISATSLEIGSGVTIPQSSIYGLENTLSNIQTTVTNAVSTASNALTGLSGLQNNLNDLQNQVSKYLNGNSGSSPNWITNAFSQTITKDGLLLSGNIFVADKEGYITAGMMGASAGENNVNAATTPRFFAGSSTVSKSNENPNDDIYAANYPFMVTADGHLYASEAELAGSLKIKRTITNNEGKSEVKLYDIGDYVIGKIDEETGKLDTRGTVSGAIDTVTAAIYGPAMTKEQLAAVDKIKNGTDDVTENDKSLIKTYNQGIMASNYLIGRILRAEGKIAALQNDINALRTGVDVGKVAYICSNCGGKFIEDVPMDGSSPAKSKPCPTCGMNTYMGLVAKGGIGNNGSIGGSTGDSTGDSSNIIDVPISRPWLPITSKDTVADMRPLES